MAYTGDFTKNHGNYNVGKKLLDDTVTMVRYIDTSVDNLANGGYYKIFAVPAQFALLKAYVVVITAEGAADTIDLVDDDSSSTTFINDADLNTANGVVVNTAGGYYSSAGYITILANADITAAKFYVIVEGIILNTSM